MKKVQELARLRKSVTNPSQTAKYNLTMKPKESLKSFVELGRTWRGEFFMVWHDLEGEISDILGYNGNPPKISRGDIRTLKREGLIDCEFLGENKARIAVTPKSEHGVDTNVQGTYE
jgi:hypothetical protein